MFPECLIIFSRYPEPGKTKTRMIPALGKEGAVKLQRQMTEHTLRQARKLFSYRSLTVEVHFAGGDRQLMQEWLGSDVTCYQQGAGDLGQRMHLAINRAFAAGMAKVVIIGTDCPDVNPSILIQAFDALKRQDLVLGPAEDGGYYLIGLNCPIPELFNQIKWGTAQVLTQTKSIANALGLDVYYLPVLPDVDRPEDLVIWQKFCPEDG
ncbi:TIGR04282 family arsenosugar biosynthesis glycosyltransferase [Pleurocapsales cyanobacterium LEGE 06147]|nr:TIGR04282 family arsenosugar biosynthesis glycosyltransferase [Pleurocapsales cyanobacterium LEGE 06147]